MSPTSYIFGIVFALIVFAAIFYNLRSGRMKERYATWWILIGVIVVIISIFPGVLKFLSVHLGVEVPLNLGLFVGGIVLLLMTLQFSVDLSKSADTERRLAEEVALLSLRVKRLEGKQQSADIHQDSD
ncbi:DUF2304 domain-containing protein [Actinomyces minihominis]|uniref:DUF2304 domain-containing protein n=1 Tax=Actinomyces minihominis TaxID=2002838 RepID=UPI000C08597C|nr:DUF2304 domain-containing protein [Actinomyces minihominis]